MRRVRRRHLAILITVLVALGLIAAAVYERARSAPEVARLLPECDGILYVNWKPVRKFVDFSKEPVAWAPEYRRFVEQTGFQFERDLDEIAFAIHAPADPQHETRYSEVMLGHFDSDKVNQFLANTARTTESYRNHEVFLIPYEDRTIRVAVLSLDMIAVSNTGDPAQIDHILDAFGQSAFATAGPALLSKYYRHVPFTSLAWLITQVAPASAIVGGGTFNPLPFIRQLFGGGVVVASARYDGHVQLEADSFLKPELLKDRANQLQNLLSLYKATEEQTHPANADSEMESALNSLKVQEKKDRVELTMSIPRGLIEKMFEPPAETATPAPPAAPEKPKAKRRRRH